MRTWRWLRSQVAGVRSVGTGSPLLHRPDGMKIRHGAPAAAGNLLALPVAAAVALSTGCSDSTGPDETPVHDILLLGAAPHGTFSPSGGGFRMGAAPVDLNGNAILDNVRADHFSIESLQINSGSAGIVALGSGAAPTATCNAAINRPQPGSGLDLALTFDVSGSMTSQDPNRMSVEAGMQFVSMLRPDRDRAAVLTFSTNVQVRQELTGDTAALNAAIDAISFGGNTALYQAVVASVDLLDAEASANPAVILLADGGNNRPGTLQEAVDRANSANIPVYSVGLGGSSGLVNLEDIAIGTGGFYRHISDPDGLIEIYHTLGVGIQQGYVALDCDLSIDPPLASTGRHTVSGRLVATMGGSTVEIPFSFNVLVAEVSGALTAAARTVHRD